MPDDRFRPFVRKTPVHSKAVAAVAAAFTLSLSATLTGSFVSPADAAPVKPAAKPDIKQVRAKVDRLYRAAEVASEHYNTAQSNLRDSRTTLKALQADLDRQQQLVDKLRTQVASSLVEQYQGQSLSTAGQVALSNDPSAFINGLSAMTAYNSQRGDVMAQYTTELSRLDLRKQALKDETASLSKTSAALAADKAKIDKYAAEAKSQLDALEAKQRDALLSGNYNGAIPDIAASGAAKTALHYALAQVGKAYVWGAAGPNAFDCSGLMLRAWGAAGIGLPHSSRAQAGMGTPVSQSQLQPGDLVFFYHPISHVGMYIGGGLMVNAENPSVGVKITSINAMPYAGAVHLG